jgi:hypothetical protein
MELADDMQKFWIQNLPALKFHNVTQNGLRKPPKKHQIGHFGPFLTLTLWVVISVT